ncbi:DUF1800 domain-containing protein [Rhizomonospora bruguierae]|uniref:DUF1800 domain-containing protein n=1 Tax=Rhizomonospora bruguierae TaxID=1581705 RepID=UPI001BCF2313|nr:DUF1800 domain-containing protein [Micromonospora sp. NBRC 107566]
MVERSAPRRSRAGRGWRPAHRAPRRGGHAGYDYATGTTRVIDPHTSLHTDIEDEPGDGPSRRRAVLALGGAAAALLGGVAAGTTPTGRRVAGWMVGGAPDPTDALAAPKSRDTGTGAESDRPAGQQASLVRTYAAENESYMGSTAGAGVAKNTPADGREYPSPAAAAAATKVTANTVLAKHPVRHLAGRATFGATPQLLADIQTMGIDAWLARQLAPETIPPTEAEVKLPELGTLRMGVADLRRDRQKLADRGIRADEEAAEATIARQIWSDRQLFEVMVDLWNDVLPVGRDFERSDVVRAAFDRDVIRRYALDNYPDMLVAANRHPALLRALDQAYSRAEAVNENLARENLERFSVGVDGGCTEVDVRQAALIQTGRTVVDDRYAYRAEDHHVGPIKVMGFAHPNHTAGGGEEAGDAYLRYLALHPSTARAVAVALATRLVSDVPPQSIVDRLAKRYLAAKGHIQPVLMTLFCSSEFWGSVGQKVRRPREYVVATYRTLGVQARTPAAFEADTGSRTAFGTGLREVRLKLADLGHEPMTGPALDVFVPWATAGALVGQWNEALTAVTGGRAMFTYTAPERLVARPPATAGAYLDALARRLVHQPLSARQRALILGVAGLPESARVDATFNGAIAAVARAILASPLHHLR